MPSFPKTPAGQERRERFNSERRAAYREGRFLGLGPRDAGHLLNPRDVSVVAGKTVDAPRRDEGTLRERQEAHREYLERLRGRAVSLRESAENLTVGNRALVETKVTLHLKDPTDGELFDRNVTLLSSSPLTRGEVRDRVVALVAKGNLTRVEGKSRHAFLQGIAVEEEVHYPEVGTFAGPVEPMPLPRRMDGSTFERGL